MIGLIGLIGLIVCLIIHCSYGVRRIRRLKRSLWTRARLLLLWWQLLLWWLWRFNFNVASLRNVIVHASLIQLDLRQKFFGLVKLFFRFLLACGVMFHHFGFDGRRQSFRFDFSFRLLETILSFVGEPAFALQGAGGDLSAMLFNRFASNVAV